MEAQGIYYQNNWLTLNIKNIVDMDVQSIKIDLIHWLTELQDESILIKIQGLKNQQNSSFNLSSEQIKELEDRFDKYEKGDMDFSSWDAVKEKIRNSKDVL
jgi:hypothetical protein